VEEPSTASEAGIGLQARTARALPVQWAAEANTRPLASL